MLHLVCENQHKSIEFDNEWTLVQLKESISECFGRESKTLLSLIDHQGTPLSFAELLKAPELHFQTVLTVIFSEESPLKKQKVDNQETSGTAEKLTKFFKKAQAGLVKSSLEDDEVQEIKLNFQQAGAKNFVDLRPLINLDQTTCLNEAPNQEWNYVLEDNAHWLESDVDEQLLFNVRFNSSCRLHSIIVHSENLSSAPKVIKLYANRFNLDFDNVEDQSPVQTVELNEEYYLSGGKKEIELKGRVWENVDSIALFVEDNLQHEATTVIHRIQFIGARK
eukprot:TRINITY_DN4745_c0_g1_i1.p1 TRINITY_DN4745_c0_g1~~TRINITY_DN4745_c0_g1_i1.p1  ORF type:complete len:279 (-),score=47.23 TRINITY_DN4745_c0_g1_i1:157-993(-)